MPPSTVLITGGTGYIALEIGHQLLSAGKYRVRASVRSLANTARNQPLLKLVADPKQGPPELFEADLLSADGWDKAIEGVDYVLHTASPFFMSENEDALVKPAVEGTLNVLRACSAPGSKVKRVVLTSSVAAVAYGRDDLPTSHVYTEADWTNADNVSAYTKSKTLAERAAWDFMKANTGHQFELCTINPSLVLGHCRTTPGTSVDIITQLMTGKIPLLPAINFGLVDVADVARAHVGALEHPGAAGERYIVSNKVASMADMANVLSAEFAPRGVKVTTARLPYWLAWAMSPFSAQVRGLLKDWDKELHIDGSKAEAAFGFQYTDLNTTIKETGQSLIDADIVKASK